MGFLGFLGKAVGSVAKAGLGVVTGGVSTQILDTVGGIIRKKKQAVNQQNLYDAAGLTDRYSPQARRTERVMPGGGNIIPAYRSSAPENVDVVPRAKRRKSVARSFKRAARATTRRPRKTTGRRRAPPPGGLDLKAMSTAWRAAGKPSSWQDWIASNPIHRG